MKNPERYRHLRVDWVGQSITLCGVEGEDIGAGQALCPAQNQSSRHQPPSGGPDFQRPSNRAPATRVGVSKSLLLQGRGRRNILQNKPSVKSCYWAASSTGSSKGNRFAMLSSKLPYGFTWLWMSGVSARKSSFAMRPIHSSSPSTF